MCEFNQHPHPSNILFVTALEYGFLPFMTQQLKLGSLSCTYKNMQFLPVILILCLLGSHHNKNVIRVVSGHADQ